MKLTEEEKEEFYELQSYILGCSGGDRSISPAARKLEKYLELKAKINDKKSKDSD